MGGAVPDGFVPGSVRARPRARFAYPCRSRMQSAAPPVPTAPTRARRRVPFAALPLVLGLAYVAVYGAIASKPSLEAMVPPDAVLVWRYRDLAAYDDYLGGRMVDEDVTEDRLAAGLVTLPSVG